MSIFPSLIPHLWEVPDHMIPVATPIEHISTYQELTSMGPTIFSTRLVATLGISIIALFGERLVHFGI